MDRREPSYITLLERVVDHILRDRTSAADPTHLPIMDKVISYTPPQLMEKMWDGKVEKWPIEKLWMELQNLIRKSVQTHHPYFMSQLFIGNSTLGVIADVITSHLNTSMYTYEVAPVFTTLERHLQPTILNLYGWTAEKSRVLWTPGGSYANHLAMNLARFWKEPESLDRGSSTKFVIYLTPHAHYSFHKGAGFLGFGRDSLHIIPTDAEGRVDLPRLADLLQHPPEDRTPLMLIATAGTTVMGNFDPLVEMAKLAQKHHLWFHVDAAFGGGVIWSHKERIRLFGADYANSITWNPHKMLNVGLQTSLLLIHDRELVTKAHRLGAEYLFPDNKPYSSGYDEGDDYLQCGRRVDVLKLWLRFKTTTYRELQKGVDQMYHLTELARSLLQADPEFMLLQRNWDSPILCFWGWPIGLPEADLEELHRIIKHKMLMSGEVMMSIQPSTHPPRASFIRWVIINPSLTSSDIRDLYHWLQRTVRKAYKEFKTLRGVDEATNVGIGDDVRNPMNPTTHKSRKQDTGWW